jgi:hypothetical protein
VKILSTSRSARARRGFQLPVGLSIVGVAIAGAGCSSSPASLSASGHGSPAATVSGFVRAYETGKVSAICAWAAPHEGAACAADVKGEKVTGSDFSIGTITTVGDKAIVDLDGNVCFKEIGVKGCSGSYSDANTAGNGVPAADFASWFQNATDGVPVNGLVPAEEVNGRWYVAFTKGPFDVQPGEPTLSVECASGNVAACEAVTGGTGTPGGKECATEYPGSLLASIGGAWVILGGNNVPSDPYPAYNGGTSLECSYSNDKGDVVNVAVETHVNAETFTGSSFCAGVLVNGVPRHVEGTPVEGVGVTACETGGKMATGGAQYSVRARSRSDVAVTFLIDSGVGAISQNGLGVSPVSFGSVKTAVKRFLAAPA